MKYRSAASFDKISTSVTKDSWKGSIGLIQSTGSDDICIQRAEREREGEQSVNEHVK